MQKNYTYISTIDRVYFNWNEALGRAGSGYIEVLKKN